jgi:4-methyl-5(b-hydroxyethyl)-thiazole monophosphate biosynthesis
VAAICAAPSVLADAGLLAGRRFTIHASMHPEFPHALTGEPVVTDGDIITSRGAGTALPFGLELVGRLYGAAAAASVAAQVMA